MKILLIAFCVFTLQLAGASDQPTDCRDVLDFKVVQEEILKDAKERFPKYKDIWISDADLKLAQDGSRFSPCP